MASPSWHVAATLNTWATLPNSNLNSSGVMHSSDSRWVIEAWGGAVLCWGGLYIGSTFTAGTFLVCWGGGHTNYNGNEVYAYGPLENDSPTWHRLRDATSPAPEDVDYDGSGNPVSRHTYSTITYVNDGTRNWMLSLGTIGRYDDAYGGGEVFVYDFNQVSPNSNQPWSRKTAHTWAGDAVVYEPSSAKVWYHPADQNRIASYSVTGDSHANSGPYNNVLVGYGGNGMAAIDTTLGIIAYWDNRSDRRLSFYRTNNGVSNDYYQPSTTGTAPTTGNGSILHDPIAGVWRLWDGNGKTIWTLTPPIAGDPYEGGDPWVWSSATPGTGSTPDAQNANGTYGRFSYSPNADVLGYILLNTYNGNIYFYKSGASVTGGGSSFNHTAIAVEFTPGAHVWTLSLAHAAGAVVATRNTHTSTLARPHTAGNVAATRGTHTWSHSFAHAAGSAVFALRTHTSTAAFAHTAGAITCTFGTHASTQGRAHTAATVAATAGTHTQAIAFNHATLALVFTTGTHANPTGYAHTAGAVALVHGVHTWTAGHAHTAGAAAFTRGAHVGFFGYSHTTGAAALTRGAHAWTISHSHQAQALQAIPGTSGWTFSQVHTAGQAGYTALGHTQTHLHAQVAGLVAFGRNTHTWSYAFQGTVGVVRLTAGSHSSSSGSATPTPNVILSTPMYTGITLSTRMDTGATLSTPMQA